MRCLFIWYNSNQLTLNTCLLILPYSCYIYFFTNKLWALSGRPFAGWCMNITGRGYRLIASESKRVEVSSWNDFCILCQVYLYLCFHPLCMLPSSSKTDLSKNAFDLCCLSMWPGGRLLQISFQSETKQ